MKHENVSRTPETELESATRRYKLLLAVTVAGLQLEINQMVDRIPSAELVESFFAQGTGFIAIMKYDHREDRREHAEGEPTVTPKEPFAHEKKAKRVPDHRRSKAGK